MNLTSLQTFLAILETGSLVRAADKLNVTQSTVTARLKTLEEELGQVLINRQKSGATLTPAGAKLMRYAPAITGLWRQAKNETGLPAGLTSACSFGCERDLWHGAGRAFFHYATSTQPGLAMSARQGSGRDLTEWIATGSIDIIVTFEAVTRASQTLYPLPAEELILCSDRRNTPMIGDPNYIFVDHGAEYRRVHAEFYHDAGIARLNFDSAWWALQYLLENPGSAYLPRSLAQRYLDEAALFIVPDAPVFHRKKSLLASDQAVEKFHWLENAIAQIQSHERPQQGRATSQGQAGQ